MRVQSSPTLTHAGLIAALAVALSVLAGCSPASTPVPVPDVSADSEPADSAVDTATIDTTADTALDTADTADGDAASADAIADGTDASDDIEDAVTPPDIVDETSEDMDSSEDVDSTDVDSQDAGSEDSGPILKATYDISCTTTADCQIPCGGGPCLSGKCAYKPKGKGACLLDLGGDKVQCVPAGGTGDTATCLVCNPTITQTSLTSVTNVLALDDAGAGVVLVDTAKNGITWNFNDKRSVSGGKSLYFGNPTTHSYGNGKVVAGTATLPALTIPATTGASPRVGFWLWLDTEESKDRDVLTVAIIEGEKSTVAWSSNAIDGTTRKNIGSPPVWKRLDFDASPWAGKSVQVVFQFDTKDSFINGFEGAYVDDLGIDTGCCAGAGDCEDGNACTTDTCGGSAGAPVCSHEIKTACCDGAADCNDDQPCTLDLCPVAGGACTHAALPGCCTDTAQCDDANECTNDACNGNQCAHADTCCKADSDCKPTNSCDIGQCIGGTCAFTSICCNVEEDCDDFNTCTKDACVASKCVHNPSSSPGCCTPVLINSAFAGTAEGWSSGVAVQGLDWHYKDWDKAKSAPGTLHFGDPTKNLAVPTTSKKLIVTAAAPPLSLIAGKETMLSFQLWSDVTGGGQAQVRVFALVEGVEITLSTLASFQIQGSWHLFNIDLTPIAGKGVQLFFEATISGFGFGTINGQGIFLDDFQVTSTCLPKKCATSSTCAAGPFSCLAGTCTDGMCTYSNGCCKVDAECDDKSLCTKDTCKFSKCNFAAIAGCCMGDGDCNDNNSCTSNICGGPGQQCAYVPVPSCCLASKDCDDKNTCTTDTCDKNKCVNQNFCCTADKECDDGETKCSIDTCVAKLCVHKLTGAAGCCTPEVWANTFDTGDLKDIQFVNSTGNATKGWQLWSAATESKSPPGVLYYGSPAQGNFDFGSATTGSATTPKFLLPASTPSSIDLWLFMDTEGGSYDQLTISVIVDGQKKPIFTKSSAGFNTNSWYNVKADLSQYMGKEVQILFYFDTIDSIGNSGKGVFIDDLKITTKCD